MNAYELTAHGALRIALTDELDSLFTGPTTDVLYRLRDSADERASMIRRTMAARDELLGPDDASLAADTLRSLIVRALADRAGVSA